MLFNIDFAKNIISSCFVFFFLIIDLYFLTLAVTAQIFNPIADLIIPIEIPSKEAKAKIEIHPLTAEAKTSVQYNLELYKPFCTFCSSIHFALIFQGNNLLFHL